MSRDAELLAQAIAGECGPVLRFFDWERPTISIGYGQPRGQIDLARMAEDGLDFAVRPTGGRAVLHWDELTYSVVIPAGHPIADLSVTESYRVLSSAIARGIARLGLPVELARGKMGDARNPSCFSSTSRYEIAIRGRKLVGSAQRRKNGAILQQGSILIGPEFRRVFSYIIASSGNEEIRDKSTCIAECLGYRPDKGELADFIEESFVREFGIEFFE